MMQEAAHLPLTQWENFYVIVGSSAGALTGLQFVVMTLISENTTSSGMLGVRAFGTPTVVHFCAVLLISAIISSPWPTLSSAALALGTSGFFGLLYSCNIIRYARLNKEYTPDLEDWIWFATLPILAYVVLLAGAGLLHSHTLSGLFLIAATSLLLLFIGIHNSWDSVTYVAVNRQRKSQKTDRQKPS
jgi:hypothetical protein